MKAVITPPKQTYNGSSLTNLLALRRDWLGFLSKLQREHGDVVRFRLGTQAMWLVSHPDDIRDVLVTSQKKFMKGRGLQMMKRLLGEGLLTSEGEFHLRQRRLVQPAFHRQRVAAYATQMVDYADRVRERWASQPPGQPLEMSREMMQLALVIAGKTLFDAEVGDAAGDVSQALTQTMHLIGRVTNPFATLLYRLPLPSNRRFEQAKKKLDEIIYRIINERRASGEDRGDLLSMLLVAQDEEGGTGRMTDEQVRDEALTIFLAGHETTATALTWTWYLLSQHPEVEVKLHAEIDSVLAGRLPTFEDVPKLRYTEMVFAESMRLYPPAWMIGRRALADHEISGHRLRQGDLVLMNEFIVQHDARWFPDPYRCDPERWTPEAREARPKFSYFPFGGGTRTCIGEAFAWMEGVLVIATIAQRWKLRLAPGHVVEIRPLVTLRPKYGMKMTLERR
ncbi:MAG TPA: cytochrome P450 [Blastocatellia bacterium]|nr:cytochrome P450 [Blastocatellia bacterium]